MSQYMDSATDQPPVRSFVFDHWLLQSDGTLLRDGQGIHVPPKELHVLRLLLGSAGTVISKDHLLDGVWPDADVAEESGESRWDCLQVASNKMPTALTAWSSTPDRCR